MQIDVDFEVWKALTLRRSAEEQSYNNVLRMMLGLGDALPQAPSTRSPASTGRLVGKRFLPDGTLLRARFKNQEYAARIEGGELIGHDGKAYGSASAAAKAVTASSVNGLAFWEAKRPGDQVWLKIGAIPRHRL